jgi:hypothetical protein
MTGKDDPAFDAEEWFERFYAAGCSMRVSKPTMVPLDTADVSSECTALWNEIRNGNEEKWNAVHALAKAKAGGSFEGWVILPPPSEHKK